MELTRLSSWYWSAPFESPPQPDFLNAVAGFETSLAPEALLDLCHRVEDSRGRTRDTFRGPRTLDLDILLHGETVCVSPRLTIPHADLHRRRFVLAPLVEVAPEIRHPSLGTSVRDLYHRCLDSSRVQPAELSRAWSEMKSLAREANKVEPVV